MNNGVTQPSVVEVALRSERTAQKITSFFHDLLAIGGLSQNVRISETQAFIYDRIAVDTMRDRDIHCEGRRACEFCECRVKMRSMVL